MHDLSHLGPKKVFIFGDGSFFITETVVWGVIVALVIGILACWSASKLQRVPKGKQVIAEFVVEKAYSMVQSVMGVKLGTDCTMLYAFSTTNSAWYSLSWALSSERSLHHTWHRYFSSCCFRICWDCLDSVR